jgi:hypothetical protein
VIVEVKICVEDRSDAFSVGDSGVIVRDDWHRYIQSCAASNVKGVSASLNPLGVRCLCQIRACPPYTPQSDLTPLGVDSIIPMTLH